MHIWSDEGSKVTQPHVIKTKMWFSIILLESEQYDVVDDGRS